MLSAPFVQLFYDLQNEVSNDRGKLFQWSRKPPILPNLVMGGGGGFRHTTSLYQPWCSAQCADHGVCILVHVNIELGFEPLGGSGLNPTIKF